MVDKFFQSLEDSLDFFELFKKISKGYYLKLGVDMLVWRCGALPASH